MDTTTINAPINVVVDDINVNKTTAGAISTAATRATEIYNQLAKLVADRQAWETTVMRTAEDALYVLLQRCYSVYETAAGDAVEAALLQVAITDYFNLNNLKLDPNVHTLNNIVKMVFGVDRKRASAYAVALRVALSDETKAVDLPTYIRNKGGIEEVRRAGKKNSGTSLTVEQKASKAKVWISADDFGSYRNDALTRDLDGTKVGNQHLLIVTQQADGSLKVNGLISTAGVVQSALAAYYSLRKDAHAADAIERATTDQVIAREAAISAAANFATN